MNQAAAVTQPTTKDRMTAAWAAFGSQDRDRIAPLLPPDAEWLAPPGNATAMAIDGNAHLIGRDRIVRFLTREFIAELNDGLIHRVRAYMDTQRGAAWFKAGPE